MCYCRDVGVLLECWCVTVETSVCYWSVGVLLECWCVTVSVFGLFGPGTFVVLKS